jgi:Icc-related predicted phosphoesterase
VRLVILSDTHGWHEEVKVPDGDVLVFCGDLCRYGHFKEVKQFANWMEKLPHKVKLVVPGNHDEPFTRRLSDCRHYFKNREITLLLDEEIVVDGVKFYGSPWTPEFCNWHFMKARGEHIAKVWEQIPEDTDVLLTHGPPYGHGDLAPPYGSPYGRAVGCLDLLNRLRKVRPLIHSFGHIHCGYGITRSDDDTIKHTVFINASICTEAYQPTNQPHVVDIKAPMRETIDDNSSGAAQSEE